MRPPRARHLFDKYAESELFRMGRLNRMVNNGLKIACLLMAALVFLKQGVVHRKQRSISEDELLTMLHNLEKTQVQNKAILIQKIKNTLSRDLGKPSGKSKESVEDTHRKITRGWFDNRPGANSSKRAVEEHPFFPGYIIENPDICKDKTVDILVYLHSAAENRHIRRSIRESWASSQTFIGINLKFLFIVGRSSYQLRQHQIKTEYAAYGDVVQGNFTDSFSNLAYKAMTMLAWMNKHCSHARYVVKVDDDMFVDMYRVISEIVPMLYPKKFAVACDVKTDLPILRNPQSRWYVNEELLAKRTVWPKFCSGYFVVATGEVIPKLYEASFNFQELIPIDDAYLFGLLPEMNVPLEYINIQRLISAFERPDSFKEITVNGKFDCITFRVESHEDHVKLWGLKSYNLSPWEQAHSRYMQTFLESEDRTVNLL